MKIIVLNEVIVNLENFVSAEVYQECFPYSENADHGIKLFYKGGGVVCIKYWNLSMGPMFDEWSSKPEQGPVILEWEMKRIIRFCTDDRGNRPRP